MTKRCPLVSLLNEMKDNLESKVYFEIVSFLTQLSVLVLDYYERLDEKRTLSWLNIIAMPKPAKQRTCKCL